MSRDHLLAEVVARAFADFASHLDARPPQGDPYGDLQEIGKAYLSYAAAHPLNYRLMFGTPLPDPDKHTQMMRKARHAFGVLRDAISQLPVPDGQARGPSPDADALYVWSKMHGLASIMQSGAITTLSLPPGMIADLQSHAFARLHAALTGDVPAEALQTWPESMMQELAE